MLDPTQFSITQSKASALWPPSDLVAHAIFPYLRRMKQDKLTIVDVGAMKGENAMYLLEKDTTNKIEKIYGITSFDPEKAAEGHFAVYEKLFDTNVKNESRIVLTSPQQDELVDVVCIHSQSDLSTNLETYYNLVKVGGIFCGNDHHLTEVKLALNTFRRKNKIGIPILVANGSWFWVKRA
jgi:hypothetical protein